jgi:hypothetical protein
MLDGAHSKRVSNCLPAVLAWVVGCVATACGGVEDRVLVSAAGGSSARSASGGAAAQVGSGGTSATLATGGTRATGGSSSKATATSTGGASGGAPSATSTGGSSAPSASGGAAAQAGSGGTSATLATGGTRAIGGSSSKASSPSTGGVGGGVTYTTSTGGSSAKSAVGGTTAQLLTGGTSATAATGGTRATGGSSAKASSSSTGGATGGASSTASTGGSPASGGAAGSSSAGAQAVQAFTSSYVTPYCARVTDCCMKAGYSAPGASCATTELGYYGALLADGSAQVNSAGVAALLNAIQNTCDEPSYTLYSNLTAGTRPVGSDCTDVGQCQGDSVACLMPSSTSVGKCVTLTRGRSGDSCAVGCDNTSSCKWTIMGGNATQTAACWDEDGFRCDSATNTCVALAGVGNFCDSSVVCGRHADCINSVCVSKGKLNESCANYVSCESTLICNSSYICEKMSIAWSGSCGP